MALPGIIDQVHEFNSDSEDWAIYIERLDQYFVANSIKEDNMKAATLISLIGAPTYKLLRDLCHPALPKDLKYEELSKLLSKQLSLRMSERLKFYGTSQNVGESISEWYARIKSVAVHYEFGGSLEQVLKDKFVSGMTNRRVLDRLCEENVSKSLKHMVDLAITRDSTEKEEINLLTKFPREHGTTATLQAERATEKVGAGQD